MKRQIATNLSHNTRRKEFAESHVPWTYCDWNKIIWTDEKWFNLDGQGGNDRYWHGKEKPARTFSKLHRAAVLIMVGAGLSKNRKDRVGRYRGRNR